MSLPFEEEFIPCRSGRRHDLHRSATPILLHTDVHHRLIVEIVTLFSCCRCTNLSFASSCILVHTSRHGRLSTSSLPTRVAQDPRSMCGALWPTKMFRMCTARKAAYNVQP